jgi:hypothetical protein
VTAAAPAAVAFELELPSQWVAVDLTDPHWRSALTGAMGGLWSDPQVGQDQEAIQLSSLARVELMAQQGAVCLLVGSYRPITTMIGGIFVGHLPVDGLAVLAARFIQASWRTATPGLSGTPRSTFSREITVPGLVGVNILERIVLIPLGNALVSMAFSGAVIGAAAELVEGVKETDRGIEALLAKLSC